MKKNDEYYVTKMLEDIDFILEHMKNVTKVKLEKNPVLEDSMMFRLVQISESAFNISDKYKEKHSEIPWMEIKGLRNRIVHDYGNVQMDVVYDTLKKDIPDLKKTLKKNNSTK